MLSKVKPCRRARVTRHGVTLQTFIVFATGLLPLVLMATGCGGVNRQVGMIVVYEVHDQKTGVAEKPDATGMQALTATIDRRLNPGYRKSGRVRPLDDGRIEVSIFRAETAEMQRIADLLPRPGTLEFRILANDHDHQQLIAQAEAKPESEPLLDAGGELLAWWVPVQDAAQKWSGTFEDSATRIVTRGDREVLEVLVVKDSFDVNGSHLERVSVATDDVGKPCIAFAFSSAGAQRLGALTGNNLPDPADQVYRKLGIIIDGKLSTAPRIMAKVSERGQITGDFTRQDVSNKPRRRYEERGLSGAEFVGVHKLDRKGHTPRILTLGLAESRE